MPEKKWNNEQLKAIESTNGNLLVSAAAGSGKTAVLVERVIRLMTGDNAVPADRFLIVTFTKLAAFEMKERIQTALAELAVSDPHNELYQNQQLNLEKSHISTIHSFCNQVVLENFNTLEITPDTSISSDNDMADLRRDAMTQTLENYYSKPNNSVYQELSDTLGGGKTDSGLENAVSVLYDFIRSLPNYEKWLDEKKSMYDVSIPAKDTVWGKIITDYSESVIRKALSDSQSLLYGCNEHNGTEFINVLSDDVSVISALLNDLSDCSWDEFRKKLLEVKFVTKPRRKTCDPEYEDLIKYVRDNYKDSIKTIQSLYLTDEAGFREDIGDLFPKIECLFSLVIDFDKAYSQLKRDKHYIDYSDLEQMTLKVLCTEDENGNIVPSDAAKEISSRFDYILVDECQDINKVQDTIISMISNGHNLFFVGDVKQSIYRFRQAMPELFLQKKEEWPMLVTDNYPATITLGRNYRSRKNITGAVNFIFKQLMTKDSAEMDYSDSEMLIPEADFPEDENVRNTFVLIKGEKDDDSKAEAEWVANDIKKLVNSNTLIRGENGQRKINYSDICILMRSAKEKGDIFATVLRNNGIDCRNEQGNSFLSRPEVAAVINVLRAIDNPLIDISLCGAMLSEMFMFTPDELSEIKLNKKNGSLYSAVKESARSGNEKCISFVAFLDKMRKIASSEPSDGVIEELYYHTSFLQISRSCENGDTKAANLRLLVKYAQDKESSGYHGLSSFLRFIEKLETSNSDFTPASSFGNGENSVSIMTVHASKGLEYPVVYLCGTKHKFRVSRSDGIFLHPSLGFACSRRDPKTGFRFKTVSQEALNIKIKKSNMAEELRILYVALTRAKENLIITCTCKEPEKYISNTLPDAIGLSPTLDSYTVTNASSESDWILTSLLRHPDSKALRYSVSAGSDGIIDDKTRWYMLTSSNEEVGENVVEEAEEIKAEPDNSIIETLNERKNWVYHHKNSETIPSKVGVSALTHGYLKKELLFAAEPMGFDMSGASRGTAVHKFLQFCNFSSVSESIDAEIDRLIERKYLTEKEAAAVDKDKIKTFVESSLFKRMKSADWFAREYRFIQSLPAPELGLGFDNYDDLVTVQGVADYVFRENGKYYVIDYKTDFVKDPDELSARYRDQLELYKKLLSRSFNVDVSGSIIWSFHLGTEIDL